MDMQGIEWWASLGPRLCGSVSLCCSPSLIEPLLPFCPSALLPSSPPSGPRTSHEWQLQLPCMDTGALNIVTYGHALSRCTQDVREIHDS